MDEREKQIRQRLKDDFVHYAAKCLRIRTKSGDIKPFELNKAQLYIHEIVEQQRRLTGKVRVIILKGRQMGCSSYTEGRFYWRVTHKFGARAFILTHDDSATQNLFEMARRFHENCPEVVKPSIKASNAKELIFGGLDSGYKIGTAGNKSVGRSSTIQFLHASEFGFWKYADEHAKGVMQAVSGERDTEIFIESTPNGVGNAFHQAWQQAEAGISEYIPIFVPWFWQPEYIKPITDKFEPSEDEAELIDIYGLTYEQLNWRRNKIVELSVNGQDGAKGFKQEYPCCPAEAFQLSGEDTFISAELAMRARKAEASPYGPLIIGVDPARFGDDRTAIIRRQGRVASKLETYIKKDTMEVAGIVHRIIERERPVKVCIDVGGLGAGVVDRLRELGHGEIVVPVNAGSKPIDTDKYYNKRAEMWGLVKEWLLDEPAQIPDSDELHADMCNAKYKYDSVSRLVIEKKEEMKKRGIRSSDTFDALALTFALPDSALHNKNDKSKKIAKTITSMSRQAANIRANRKE